MRVLKGPLQAILGGINLNDPEFKNGDNQPSLEALTIFRHVDRITRGGMKLYVSADGYLRSTSNGGGCHCETIWGSSQAWHGIVGLLLLGRGTNNLTFRRTYALIGCAV